MGNWALEAVEAIEVAEAAEVNEAGEVSNAWKLWIKSSRFLNSIILELLSLYFDVLKKKLTKSRKIMLNFSTFSVGGC